MNNNLTFSNELPVWLEFFEHNLTFHGAPTEFDINYTISLQASDGYLNISDTFYIDLSIEPIQYLTNDESNKFQNQFEMYQNENSIKVGRNFSF